MSMLVKLLAFCLPMGVFLFWGILGYAALSLLRSQKNILQNILLAPGIGLSLVLIAVFVSSRAGLPVGQVAIPLSLFLLLASTLILWWKKPPLPFSRYLPFAGILLAALFLIAWPLLQLGFNWISFSNDDMLNYVLGAQLLLKHGYLEIPDAKQLVQGQNYSFYYWFLHVIVMERTGSQLLLAWLSRVTQLSTLESFMPLILAMHLTIISATGAMVYQAKRWRNAALTACLLLACSGLGSLGTLSQLAGQVGGLALLITTAILLFQPFILQRKRQIFQHGVLISLAASALLVTYTELAPFLGVAFALYVIIGMLRGWRPTLSFFLVLALSLFLSIIILNTYWISIIAIFNIQITKLSAPSSALGALFPYFLIPSGAANFWNLQPLSFFGREPWMSGSILLGLILTATAIIMTLFQAAKKYTPALILAVMFFLSIGLFKSQSGFPLFKLTMYMQPFLWAVLAMGLFTAKKHRLLQIAAISFFALTGISAQHYYLICSKGSPGRSFIELPNASQSGLIREAKGLQRQIPPSSGPIIADTPNIVAAKILALYLQGNKTYFYADSFFTEHFTDNLVRNLGYYHNRGLVENFFPREFEALKKLHRDIYNHITTLRFPLQNPQQPELYTSFIKPTATLGKTASLLRSTPKRGIFNRRKFINQPYANFDFVPLQKASNHLIFINSSLGQYYYLGELEHISLYNLDKDYFYPDNTVSWLGRYLLMQVVNPSKKIRLEINISTSLNHDGSNQLPLAQVIGNKRITLPLKGRGSARVFSPVILPRLIHKTPYLMLDMAQNGKTFPFRHKGLMKLFGNELFLDHRSIIAFARNISLLSEEEYKKLTPPSSISTFPADLANQNLEYSGIYEDGWLSEAAFLKLTEPAKNTRLSIKGMIPEIKDSHFTTTLNVYVDAKKVSSQKFGLGEFKTQIKIPYAKGPRKIELYFSKAQILPPGDDRPVGAKLEFIGFV